MLVLLIILVGATATAADLPRYLALPSCVACAVDPGRARVGYSEDEWNALHAGEIVISKASAGDEADGRGATVEASALIRRPPSLVWTTLVDFESRPRFQPDTKDVRIVRTEGNRVWVAQHLRFFLVDVRFTAINTLEPERGVVSWMLDESADHDIAATTGSWQLTPLEDGRATLLTYRSRVDTGRSVPRFVERFLLKRSLPALLTGIRAEVERR